MLVPESSMLVLRSSEAGLGTLMSMPRSPMPHLESNEAGLKASVPMLDAWHVG